MSGGKRTKYIYKDIGEEYHECHDEHRLLNGSVQFRYYLSVCTLHCTVSCHGKSAIVEKTLSVGLTNYGGWGCW